MFSNAHRTQHTWQQYSITNIHLSTTDQQWGPRIVITRDFNWQNATETSRQTVNRVLEIIATISTTKTMKWSFNVQISCSFTTRIYSSVLIHTYRREEQQEQKEQRRATQMILENRNHSYKQWLKHKTHQPFTMKIGRAIINRSIEIPERIDHIQCNLEDLTDKIWNNGAKLVLKHFNTSVANIFTKLKFQQPGMLVAERGTH